MSRTFYFPKGLNVFFSNLSFLAVDSMCGVWSAIMDGFMLVLAFESP